MTTRTRIITALAALSLLLVFAFPIWSVTLEAPQYPEGIGMEIWVNTVKGQGPHDLHSINKLNQYIGMKPIEPDAIPELQYMPWIIGALVVLGLAAAASGKRWALYTWVALFLVTCVAGMVDFWLWNYDYGHDLDPEAVIQVPGMTYQPPLIGSKQMLNITAHSWPALGGIVTFLAAGVSVALAGFEWWRNRSEDETTDDETGDPAASEPSPSLQHT